jgi:DNA-binding LytR/AlgR family response regulator
MNYFFIENALKGHRIDLSEILYLKTTGCTVQLVTSTKLYSIPLTLAKMQKKLPRHRFLRVHPSYLVHLDRVISFDLEKGYILVGNSEAVVPGIMLPLSSLFLPWYKKNCIPAKKLFNHRGFSSLLNDLLSN